MERSLEMRVSLVETPKNKELADLFTRIENEWGSVINLYRALGNSPAMLEAWISMTWPLRHAPVLSRRVRELAILQVAHCSRTDYEWEHHKAMARQAHISLLEVEAISNNLHNECSSFNELEHLALDLASEMTLLGEGLEKTVLAIRDVIGDEQLVELTLTIAFYNCVTRVLKTLAIPLE